MNKYRIYSLTQSIGNDNRQLQANRSNEIPLYHKLTSFWGWTVGFYSRTSIDNLQEAKHSDIQLANYNVNEISRSK